MARENRGEQMDETQVDWSDIAYDAWGVIANVSGGEWGEQGKDWQEAAARWRDRFHNALLSEPAGEVEAVS